MSTTGGNILVLGVGMGEEVDNALNRLTVDNAQCTIMGFSALERVPIFFLQNSAKRTCFKSITSRQPKIGAISVSRWHCLSWGGCLSATLICHSKQQVGNGDIL